MAASAYITAQDIPTYLKDVSPAPNAQAWNWFASVVSRWLDDQLGQYFYSDGLDTKYWDSEGGGLSNIDTGGHPFYGKVGNVAAVVKGATTLTYTPFRGPVPSNGDVLTLDVATTQEQVTVSGAPTNNNDGTWAMTLASPGTAFAHVAKTSTTTLQVQLAYFENQPTANWTSILSGDGVRPPSNYYCWPRRPKPAGSSADPTARDPWFGIDIAHIPISNTTYLPTAIPGYVTIGITAHWGWPAVPDPIKDIAGRLTAKMWRARGAGWSEEIGSSNTGVVHSLLKEWNALDGGTLIESRFKNIWL
jgi:hypothetical protein